MRVKYETALPLQIPCDYLTIMDKKWELEQFAGEREMLLEHKPTGQCFHSFFEFFQTFKSVCMRRYRVPHLEEGVSGPLDKSTQLWLHP